MRFRVGYHCAEPMRKRDGESYDVERGNGTVDQCCVADAEQLWILKGKTYEDINGDQQTEGPVEERSGSDEKGETRRRI